MNPLLSSALVSAGTSTANGLFGQLFAGVNARRDYHYFTKKMDYQDKIQDENIANERAYNSPAAVSARMRAAGLAPQTANNANAGLSSASPGVSTDGAGSGPLPQLDMSALTSRLAQQSTTPVEKSEVAKNEALEGLYEEKSREQKIKNDAMSDPANGYIQYLQDYWKSLGYTNEKIQAETKHYQKIVDNADKLADAEVNKAFAQVEQAAAAKLNADVNFDESQFRRALWKKDLTVKDSQIFLNKQLGAQANANQRKIVTEVNKIIKQMELYDKEIERIAHSIWQNWVSVGLDGIGTIVDSALGIVTKGLSGLGSDSKGKVVNKLPLLFGSDNKPVSTIVQ